MISFYSGRLSNIFRFYDWVWKKGVLVSIAHHGKDEFLGCVVLLGRDRGDGEKRVRKGQRENLLSEDFQCPSVERTQDANAPYFEVCFQSPNITEHILGQRYIATHHYTALPTIQIR